MKRIKAYAGWDTAKGSAGYNVGDTTVYGRYENGVALFAWTRPNMLGKPSHSCVVTGHLTTGGETLEQAMENGVLIAQRYGVSEADRRLSRKQFAERLDNPERLH